MAKILGLVGAITAIIGTLFLLNMFWAAANNGGMAVLGLQVFGLISSLAGIAFGGLSLFFARPDRTLGGEIGFGLGLGNILALLIAYVIF